MLMVNQLIGFGAGSSAAALTYTTWNSADKGADMTLSGGDLTATAAATAAAAWVRSVSGKSSGKYYVEMNFDNFTDQDDHKFGISKAGATISSTTAFGGDANSLCIGKNGAASTTPQKRTGGTSTNLGSSATYASGKKLMMAVDIDNGKIWWGYDGTWFDSGDPAAGTNAQFTSGISGNTWYVGYYQIRNPIATTTNFGTSAFTHTLPSGFTGWTT